MKMHKFYTLIAITVCLICGFGLYQIIISPKPKVDLQIKTVVGDLREFKTTSNQEQSKIIVPDKLKPVEIIEDKSNKKEETVTPKPLEPTPQNIFERGGFGDQQNAYKI
jgi:hypothetical protein